MYPARPSGIAAHAQLPAPCLGNYLTPPLRTCRRLRSGAPRTRSGPLGSGSYLTLPPLADGSCLSRAQPAGPRPAFVVPRRPRRIADRWTDQLPEDSRQGQRKRRPYGAGGVRRKAECGRRWRPPPQRCGPRPSPQVTGRPSPSRSDPPFSSPPGGPGTAKFCVLALGTVRGRAEEAHLRIFFFWRPTGSGGT